MSIIAAARTTGHGVSVPCCVVVYASTTHLIQLRMESLDSWPTHARNYFWT